MRIQLHRRAVRRGRARGGRVVLGLRVGFLVALVRIPFRLHLPQHIDVGHEARIEKQAVAQVARANARRETARRRQLRGNQLRQQVLCVRVHVDRLARRHVVQQSNIETRLREQIFRLRIGKNNRLARAFLLRVRRVAALGKRLLRHQLRALQRRVDVVSPIGHLRDHHRALQVTVIDDWRRRQLPQLLVDLVGIRQRRLHIERIAVRRRQCVHAAHAPARALEKLIGDEDLSRAIGLLPGLVIEVNALPNPGQIRRVSAKVGLFRRVLQAVMDLGLLALGELVDVIGDLVAVLRQRGIQRRVRQRIAHRRLRRGNQVIDRNAIQAQLLGLAHDIDHLTRGVRLETLHARDDRLRHALVRRGLQAIHQVRHRPERAIRVQPTDDHRLRRVGPARRGGDHAHRQRGIQAGTIRHRRIENAPARPLPRLLPGQRACQGGVPELRQEKRLGGIIRRQIERERGRILVRADVGLGNPVQLHVHALGGLAVGRKKGERNGLLRLRVGQHQRRARRLVRRLRACGRKGQRQRQDRPVSKHSG